MTEPENISPLPGISPDEYTKLLLSVGGTSNARRPYSPVEVGELLVRTQHKGTSPKEMAVGMKMTNDSMARKFLKLVNLDESILHLVTWGASADKALGFSVAAHLSRLEPSDQPLFAEKCLAYGITKDEATSVIQLYQRSGQSLEECIARVVARRPTTRTLEVILGSIAADSHVRSVLESMTQLERDELFQQVVNHVYPEVSDFSAKLGKNRFTIIGGKSVGKVVASDKFFSEKLNEGLRTFVNTDIK